MIDKINDGMLVPADWESSGALIKVIGIGGGGHNAVNNMFHTGIEGVHFVACNTDAQVLRLSPLDTKIQLGAQGLGAGCDPDRGKQAAEESIDKINEVLDNNTQMVFLTAGMGGGTGTGATPVIAKAAKEKGILTVAIVTMPFSDEGLDFTRRAREGVLELQRYVDSLLVINNDRLYEFYGELPLKQAFAKADGILTTAVKGIAEIITRPGHINVDFADVRRAMENSNVAVMGSGSASGEGRALRAAEEALSSPLLNYGDISGAKNVLVNITASDENLKTKELKEAMEYIQKCAGGIAGFVKRGILYDNTLGDTMYITIVATGFHMQPFIDVPEIPEGRVIMLGGDAPSEEEGGSEQSAVSSRQPAVAAGIEVDNNRRVFEEAGSSTRQPAVAVGGSSRQLAVGNPQPKPALILDENTDEELLRRVPAYLRRKVAISMPADHNDAPASTLTSTTSGGHRLNSDNAYLHQHLD
jgi:cell division protein FtsZ